MLSDRHEATSSTSRKSGGDRSKAQRVLPQVESMSDTAKAGLLAVSMDRQLGIAMSINTDRQASCKLPSADVDRTDPEWLSGPSKRFCTSLHECGFRWLSADGSQQALDESTHDGGRPVPSAEHTSGLSTQDEIVAGMLAASKARLSRPRKADVDLREYAWKPKPSQAEAAKEQRKRIGEALAHDPRKKEQKRYAWPSLQKGMSEGQASRQAAGSMARLDDQASFENSVCAAKPYNLFAKCDIPDVESDGCGVGIVTDNDDVSVEPHAVHGGVVSDESKRPIFWPWEQEALRGPSTSTRTWESAMHESAAVQRTTSMRRIRQRHNLDDLIDKALDMSSSDGQRGRKHVGVRAWFSFCEDVMGVSPHRPMDPMMSTLYEKLEEEWLGMRFVCALVRDRGITPTSAGQYFSSFQGWHAREHGVKLAGGLKLERLPQMLKGLRRIVGETPRELRRAVMPQALKRGMDLLLDPSDPVHANIRAALASALQGLMRSAEYTSTTGEADNLTIMRSDLVQLNHERMVVMMHPCKNMKHVGGKTCPLVIGGGGEYVDAVWEVQNLLRVDPTPSGRSDSTPLFRDPRTNKPLKYSTINQTVKEVMVASGESPEGFSTHGLRIGGATALFAKGANETVIRTMGRWSSDLHRLYVRACFEQCCEWTRKAGSASSNTVSGAEFDPAEVDDY